MEPPVNVFKRRLLAGEHQVGLWCTLPGSYVTEALAGSGYDWMLLDTEHSPADPLTIYPSLQALAAYPVSPVVRPAAHDATLVKRLLDLGAQTLLIPYVQTPDEARAAAAAMRYPPAGIRGVSAVTRATRFGRVAGYGRRAHEELCLIVQMETLDALEHLEEMAAVEGIDGVFIGPADLAASMGHVGEPGHPDVKAAIEDAARRLAACGKPWGILTSDPAYASECRRMGSRFTAIGVDCALLVHAAEAVRQKFESASTWP